MVASGKFLGKEKESHYMKKPYQIESQRAVKQLEAMAADGNPAGQMVLPMAEMLGWLHKVPRDPPGCERYDLRLYQAPGCDQFRVEKPLRRGDVGGLAGQRHAGGW